MRFFTWKIYHGISEYVLAEISIFCENLWRYLQLNMKYQYHQHWWQGKNAYTEDFSYFLVQASWYCCHLWQPVSLTLAAIYCIDGLLDASSKFSCVIGTSCTFVAGVNDTVRQLWPPANEIGGEPWFADIFANFREKKSKRSWWNQVESRGRGVMKTWRQKSRDTVLLKSLFSLCINSLLFIYRMFRITGYSYTLCQRSVSKFWTRIRSVSTLLDWLRSA